MQFTEKTQRLMARALAAMEKEAKYNEQQFHSAAMAKDYFTLRLADRQREVFSVAFLTSQHTLIECEDLFLGTIRQAPVYPREIVKRALELNAAAILIAHNHPSGVDEPSRADKEITELITEACHLMDIKVLDHFVVTTNSTYSFAEHGLI